MRPNKQFQPTVLASLRSARPAAELRRSASSEVPMKMAKIASIVAMTLSTLLIVVGFSRLDGYGSREMVACMATVLAGALIAFAIADSKS